MRRPIAFAFGLWILAGCQPVFENDRYDIQPGFLDVVEPAHVELPDTVAVGVPFELRVRTYGLSGCYERYRTDVSIIGGRAEVRPFDRVNVTQGIGCTDKLEFFMHQAIITLSQRGQATVRVHGKDYPEGNAIFVDRQVFVR